VQGLRLSSKVRSVTLLQSNSNGEVTAVVLHKDGGKKKRKTSGGLRVVEKVLLQLMDAQKETTDGYRRRFKSSSRKKRDGWLVDMPANMFKAVRDGARTIRLERIV
jgi:hypothetical protein